MIWLDANHLVIDLVTQSVAPEKNYCYSIG